MSKFLYRLWIPQAGIHGSTFDQICEKCQGKIEAKIEDGFVLPTSVSIDTSIGTSIRFGFSFRTVDLCEECSKKFKEWFQSQDYFHFNDNKIQLWRNAKEEEIST